MNTYKNLWELDPTGFEVHVWQFSALQLIELAVYKAVYEAVYKAVYKAVCHALNWFDSSNFSGDVLPGAEDRSASSGGWVAARSVAGTRTVGSSSHALRFE